MDYVKINGVSYDVLVTDVAEYFNILYSENTGRNIDGKMILDPLGRFIGHKVTFARKNGKEDQYDNLFMELGKPVENGISVEIVHNQGVLKYDAYVPQGERKLQRISNESGKVFWGAFTANFIPIGAHEDE